MGNKQYYDAHLINFSSSSGYPTIFINGKNVLLHRYIWEKHNGTIPDGFQIHHKDKDRKNYDISNLTLVRDADHSRHHALEHQLGKDNKGKRKDHISGFCGARRPVVASKNGETLRFESICEASRKLNIKTSQICRVLKGARKTTRGWEFRYGITREII